ncbi:SGNH/GDSL hydrolase family protein [Chitinophaga sp. MM2321]|uniref:SGNH/GDSL hydrolase family protein n=1 Tax=Chitinophaga sp. MM2321 TaxID=3137178 RepID=UPI0032D589CF
MKKNNENNRRSFIKSLSVSACLLSGIPATLAAVPEEKALPGVPLKKDDIILFQGDSITDWHRKTDITTSNDSEGMGSGYALLTAAALLDKHPEKNLQIFNRGISGNGIKNLAARWDNDCLSLKPNVLSILIGVNDFSMKLRDSHSGNATTFREAYQQLLDRTMAALPEVKLIIAEPFAIKGLFHVNDSWFPAFDEYRHVAKELAEKYNAAFIPLQHIFEKAQQKAPASYWSGDGIHTTLAGAKLMANAWQEVFKPARKH